MSLEDALNIEKLSGIYLKANVPGYLYRHFREDESILELSKYKTAELVGLFEKYVKKDFSFDNLVIIYSLIMALSFKNYSEINRFFKEVLSKYQLEWFDELASICLAEAKATTTIEMDVPKKPRVSLKDVFYARIR